MYTSNWIAKKNNRLRQNSFLGRLCGACWFFVLWLALAAVLLVDLTPPQPNFEVGAVSQQSIRAPQRITYHSEIRTERNRERAANDVEPIFFPPDRAVMNQQISRSEDMAQFLTAVRQDPYADEEAKITQIGALQPIQFEAELIDTILSLSEEDWNAVQQETQRLLRSQMRSEIRESDLPGVLRNLPNQINANLSDEQERLVRAWARGLITSNTFLDSERTEEARVAAREGVVDVEWSYEAGQIVVREGDIVAAEQQEALQQLGYHDPVRSISSIVATSLLLLLLVVVLGLYISRLHPLHYASHSLMSLIVIFLVSMAFFARLTMAQDLLVTYLLPTSVAGMLLSVLLGVDIAILATVVLAMIVGALTESIELITYTLIGGMVASLLLWRVERLATFVSTGVLVGLVNIAVVIVFGLQDTSPDWIEMARTSSVAFLNGIASASIALAGFYVLSSMLGITTFLQLMDLARPTHPLFRELLLKAPGTYHHSIVVSNLSEAAAEAVGADMLLVRVAAYYHDIGKTIKPQYYIENQGDGVNIHDTLNDPYESANIILSHVTEGIALAQRHKLPKTLIDFIAQHHGTTLVSWFYHQACKQDGKENVEIGDFRYAGPKPQSREAAIMMLADTVEAASRAVKPAGVEEIDALIRKLIAGKLADGQMDECDLNLRDIDLIRGAFVNVLQGIYHPRIAYPDGKKKPPPKLPAPEANGQDPSPAAAPAKKNQKLIEAPKSPQPAKVGAVINKQKV
ncbi:MAG: HD family phosphohydrolase [Ardenticatenaceae bacterium]